MPILCENYDLFFTHVPKTGGMFVSSVLVEHMGGEQVGTRHATYRVAPPPRDVGHRVFVVRDPVSWYKSYWAWARGKVRHQAAWPIWAGGDRFHPTYRLDVTGGARTFPRFVQKMLTEFPNGFVRSMYCDFLNGTTHALRSEHLTRDLEWLLRDVGFERPELVREMPRVNETRRTKGNVVTIAPKLEARLREVDNLDGLLIPYVPADEGH